MRTTKLPERQGKKNNRMTVLRTPSTRTHKGNKKKREGVHNKSTLPITQQSLLQSYIWPELNGQHTKQHQLQQGKERLFKLHSCSSFLPVFPFFVREAPTHFPGYSSDFTKQKEKRLDRYSHVEALIVVSCSLLTGTTGEPNLRTLEYVFKEYQG